MRFRCCSLALLPLLFLCPAAAAAEADVTRLSPDAAYDAAFAMWAEGRQADAEELLYQAAVRHPRDQRILFFAAACMRSRFDVETSMKIMSIVESLDPGTPEGQAATLINSLDRRQHVNLSFDGLKALAFKHRDRPMLMWMLAVQCRSLSRNEEGVGYYKALLAKIHPKPGPVLLHQTYANLLDEIDRHEEAFVQRRLAVEMEPAGWSYQGLGNTLSAMKRFDEAGAAFEKAVELSPLRANYWTSWGLSLCKAGKLDDAIQKSRHAVMLDRRQFQAWNVWGMCLEQRGDLEGALKKYRSAIKANPSHEYSYDDAARVLRRMGRLAEANQVNAEWKRSVALGKEWQRAKEQREAKELREARAAE